MVQGKRTDAAPCVCICDREIAYGQRLAEYFISKNTVPWDIHLYSGWDKLLAAESPQAVVLLIVAQSQYTKEVKEAGFPSVLLLCEEEVYLDTPENMSKYQSVEAIARKAQEMCASEAERLPGSMRHGKPMKLIGVYSPVTRCLQTTFALCMGQLLARKAPALYLNFEAYSGLEIMLERSFRGSVSDLLYYNDCAREKLSGQLGIMTEKMGELDFIPPMESWISMASIRGEQWMELFRSIENVTQYEFCILDLSEHVDGILEILRQCDIVFTITREDGFSQAKLRQYEALLKSSQYEDIFIKTRRCRLPVFRTLPADITMLTRGELSSFVEALMEREGLA